MRLTSVPLLRSPVSREAFSVEGTAAAGGTILEGYLVSESGASRFPIRDGIAHFVEPREAAPSRDHAYYQEQAAAYDKGMDWLFQSFYENEDALRERLVDLLQIGPGAKVLETGCGTCRDSMHLARRIGSSGQLFMQDLSDRMLLIGRDRLGSAMSSARVRCELEFLVGDACVLPFADGVFDAAFHFGGINLFGDVRGAISEMARVVRPGGRVVLGDEGVAPWLAGSDYAEILINSNPLYRHGPPLALLPRTATDVAVHWILGNAFYVVAFSVSPSGPRVDLDLPIPGARGGTHRTRYYGKLEGVSPELRTAVQDAARADGRSAHEWTEDALRAALERLGRWTK